MVTFVAYWVFVVSNCKPFVWP